MDTNEDIVFNKLVDQLEKFVFYLAHKNENPDVIGMEFDDIVGELFEEIFKGYQYYRGRNLTEGEMTAVLKRMLDNRVGELRYKHYKTSRVIGNKKISIDVEVKTFVEDVDNPSPETSFEADAESRERVNKTREKLSDDTKAIFDIIVSTDPFLTTLMKFAALRRKGGANKIQPWQISTLTGMSERQVKRAFEEISEAYEEVCNVRS